MGLLSSVSGKDQQSQEDVKQVLEALTTTVESINASLSQSGNVTAVYQALQQQLQQQNGYLSASYMAVKKIKEEVEKVVEDNQSDIAVIHKKQEQMEKQLVSMEQAQKRQASVLLTKMNVIEQRLSEQHDGTIEMLRTITGWMQDLMSAELGKEYKKFNHREEEGDDEKSARHDFSPQPMVNPR